MPWIPSLVLVSLWGPSDLYTWLLGLRVLDPSKPLTLASESLSPLSPEPCPWLKVVRTERGWLAKDITIDPLGMGHVYLLQRSLELAPWRIIHHNIDSPLTLDAGQGQFNIRPAGGSAVTFSQGGEEDTVVRVVSEERESMLIVQASGNDTATLKLSHTPGSAAMLQLNRTLSLAGFTEPHGGLLERTYGDAWVWRQQGGVLQLLNATGTANID